MNKTREVYIGNSLSRSDKVQMDVTKV